MTEIRTIERRAPVGVRMMPVVAAGALGYAALVCDAGAQVRGRPVATAKVRAPAVAEQGSGPEAASPAVREVLVRTAPGAAAAVSAALAEYRATGVARPVAYGTVIALPFGHLEPVVTCTVLRACVIELEAGEQLADTPVAGDPVRWSVDGSKTGPGGETPLVLVKPRGCDVTTNLIVPTDRRVYDLTLDSPPCARGSLNPRRAGVRHVRFYYPDDAIRRDAPAILAGAARPAEVRPPDALASIAAQAAREGRGVNRAYRVVRRRRGPLGLFGRKRVDFPWQPAGVADDGARTYVALPANAASHAAPVLYAIEEDGSRTMVNYAVRTVAEAPVYVADRVVRRAVLVVMAGARERTLEIENRGWGKAAPAARTSGGHAPGEQGAERHEVRE